MAEQTRRRGRPRQPQTDARVLTAAAELLREKGPKGVTIEAVAARSAVARTTIYRRFASRHELITAVTGSLVDRPLPPPELPLWRQPGLRDWPGLLQWHLLPERPDQLLRELRRSAVGRIQLRQLRQRVPGRSGVRCGSVLGGRMRGADAMWFQLRRPADQREPLRSV